MQRIGLVLKSSEESAIVLGKKICDYVKGSGRDVLLEPSCSELASQWGVSITDHLCDDADLLVVLGGDGTILRAVSLFNAKSVPVLGVNLGRVGFMADVAPADAVPALEAAFQGTAVHAKRMMLQVTLPDGKKSRVLNDVVIHWGKRARLIDVGVQVGDSEEIEVRADGLIVSTPIGSSAYSFAANGPLVHPRIEAILLTPICSYSGLNRPLIIPPDLSITLFMRRGEFLILTLDGHDTVNLEVGQSIFIEKSPLPFVTVNFGERRYLDVLQEKLGLLRPSGPGNPGTMLGGLPESPV